jgi:DNA invertase Pin-like site-specific DNA recombinase
MTAATAPPIPNSSPSPTGSPTGGCAEDGTSPTLTAIPDSPLRGVSYIRESTEEQGQGFSPDAQREGIRRFAPENNLELIGEYCDFHSGWRKSEARPEFQRLMADAAEGKFDVVLVYHTSRFARNQVEARRYKQLLRERLGIRVVSVTQPMGEDPSDPSSFLAESIHEMFDEYYSVSLSFWTRSGLREKARQGHLVGSLPWGYIRDPETKLAVQDPERAPLVLQLFERYATGQESDRTLAAWLNATGARTARDRQFGKDTVREMLCNAAYAGYVSGLRDKSRSIRGLHEPIIGEELFDRVQEGARRSSSQARPPMSTRCASCSTASAAAPGCTARPARRRACAVICARPAATGTPAASRSSKRASWRRNWWTGYAAFSQTENSSTSYSKRCALTPPSRTPSNSPPSAAANCSPSYSAYAISTCSATSPNRSTSCAAKRSRKNCSASARPQSPPSTALARSSPTSAASGTWRPSPPSAASSYSRCLSRSGRRKGRSSPCNRTTPFYRSSRLLSNPYNTDAKTSVPKAGATGLEPATSGVTGRRSNQLSYAPAFARVGPLPAGLRASSVCQSAAPLALLAVTGRRRLSVAAHPHTATALPTVRLPEGDLRSASSAPSGKLASQPVFV